MFGARGAVWAYNRFHDGLMHIGRIILLLMLLHYVDDAGATESQQTANSGFEAFESLAEALGVQLKTSKRQPPHARREALGVVLDFSK